MSEDYDIPNREIIFYPPGNRAMNVSINITNDGEDEKNETFSVKLVSKSPQSLRVGHPNETVITILDNDGKIFL